MQLWELKPGDRVTLEVVWGTAVYPLSAVVYRPVNDGIYVKAFYKNGQLLDFSNKAFGEAKFNVYAYLENNDTRVVWKNVSLGLQKLRSDYYYIINATAFAKNSAEVNRRANARVKIFGAGTINVDDTLYTVLMKDISNSGVAFTIGEDLNLIDKFFELEFSDDANGHEYNLNIKCRGVRMMPQSHGTLVGCMITEGGKDLIFYVYYKLLESKSAENIDQTLKMDTTTASEPEPSPQPKKGTGMHFERNRR